MIISYPASSSRVIVLLKTLRRIIGNLKEKKVKERNAALEKTVRRGSFFEQMQCKKQKGRENLSMCCNVSVQSKLNEFNLTSRGERKGFALEKSDKFIGSELLLMVSGQWFLSVSFSKRV